MVLEKHNHVFWLAALVGCGTGSHWAASMAWTEETPPPIGSVIPETGKLTQQVAGTSDGARIGVRHDLDLQENEAESPCSCLLVHVGPVDSPRFSWAGGVPQKVDSALAIALRTKGPECQDDSGGMVGKRASISAIDEQNGDVVVEVEEANQDVPVAHGAVIPRPSQDGHVFVRAKSAGLPYAKSGDERGCRVY